MAKISVYSFAKRCMSDDDFNCGGIVKNERKYLDAIGFDYVMEDGCIAYTGDDLTEFYKAMEVIRQLQIKYSR